ncbi:hypothetical protein ACWDE9_34525, partial [Streptomyces olivaceoviridis]
LELLPPRTTAVEEQPPVSKHPVPDVMPGAVTKGGSGGVSAREDEVPSEVYMRCRCRLPHPGDARESGGCGAKWVAVRQPGTGS